MVAAAHHEAARWRLEVGPARGALSPGAALLAGAAEDGFRRAAGGMAARPVAPLVGDAALRGPAGSAGPVRPGPDSRALAGPSRRGELGLSALERSDGPGLDRCQSRGGVVTTMAASRGTFLRHRELVFELAKRELRDR